MTLDDARVRSPFRCALDSKASLGECPVWSTAEQVLYWVDINAPTLNRFDPATGINTAMPMPESIGSFALRRDGGFVVATVTARSNLLSTLGIGATGVSAVEPPQ